MTDLDGLLREDGSVVIPPALADEVLRRLVRDMTREARESGCTATPGARRLVEALFVAKQRHEGRQAPDQSSSECGTSARNFASVSDMATRMGCSESYVRRLARQGRIPARRVGSTWLIEEEKSA